MYEYMATVTRVVDGDTLWLDVDLGCDVHLGLSIRLNGVNTPEMNTAAGKDAKAYTSDWVSEHADDRGRVILRTVKDRREKYGRYLGDISAGDDSAHLVADLIASGNGVPYDGGAR